MVENEADWNLYRTFLAVIRTGSLSAAARALGSTQPTIGRQIESLEAALDAELFTRSQRGLLPTAAAMELAAHAESMDAAAAAFRRASTAGATEESGTVRLTVGAQIGIEVLPQMLTDFSRQHPQIKFELSISSRAEDLLHRDADIAIRMSRPTQKALVARRVGKVMIGLYVHRSYVEIYDVPRSESALTQHRLIGFDRDMHLLRSFGGVAATLRREDFAFRTDSVTAQLALLRAGMGIGACHAHLAQSDSELIPVLAKQLRFEREVWLVLHADLKKTRRVRLLFDHLQRELTQYFAAHWLE
jgi:DNA-binding transcriptional LysR family regulator